MIDLVSLEDTQNSQYKKQGEDSTTATITDYQPRRALCYIKASSEVSPGHVVLGTYL